MFLVKVKFFEGRDYFFYMFRISLGGGLICIDWKYKDK